jgi:benzoate/toluate 1,2-dioxygenase beta subunit
MTESDNLADLYEHAAVSRFLHREARLLDRGEFDEWLSLFAERGIYWVPSMPGQTDPKAVPSIVYEDPPLLAMRIKRLQHPRAHAVATPPRTARVIGNIEIVDRVAAEQRYRVLSTMIVAEYQDERRRVFAGQVEHRLVRTNDSLKIEFKRVELIDCDGIHEFMTVPL